MQVVGSLARVELRLTREREVFAEGTQLRAIGRSAFTFAKVYNLLPQSFVDVESVPQFQSGLQKLVKDRLKTGEQIGHALFSPRVAMEVHPLCRP